MRFTRFGMFYILFTIAVGAAAINTGNNLLYLILGIQLSLIIVSGFLSDSGLWGLRSQWQPTEDLFAGQPSHWRVTIHKGWFPAALVKIEGEWNSGVMQQVWAPWIAHRQSISADILLTPRTRGWFSLKKVRYSTAFPFGLFEKIHTETRDDATLVFPSLYPVNLRRLLPQEGNDANTQAAQRAGEGSVPWRLRDYQEGDSLRRMDWKAAAKRQRWIVKETEEDASVAPVLFIDAWPQEDGEHFISFIASMVWAAMKAGRAVEFFTPDHHFPGGTTLTHYRQVWRYLALVDLTSRRMDSSPDVKKGINAINLWKAHRHDALA